MTTVKLIKKCKEAISIQIAKQYHKEANEIIELTTNDFRKQFLDYHNKDIGNICCLILDITNCKLVQEGKLIFNDYDSFG